MSENCLFCRITKGEIPAKITYQDDSSIIFQDIHPQAPTHLLLIHRRHSADLSDLLNQDFDQVTELFLSLKTFLKEHSQIARSYRLLSNIGPDSGQSVFHTHFHLLSGAKLSGKFGL